MIQQIIHIVDLTARQQLKVVYTNDALSFIQEPSHFLLEQNDFQKFIFPHLYSRPLHFRLST